MKITVSIKTCRSCHHIDHSGSFTVRGARNICGHSDACGIERTSKTKWKKEYPEYGKRDIDEHWKYHWIHRVLTKDAQTDIKEIPEWCPLKHGSKY